MAKIPLSECAPNKPLLTSAWLLSRNRGPASLQRQKQDLFVQFCDNSRLHYFKKLPGKTSETESEIGRHKKNSSGGEQPKETPANTKR